MIRRNYWTNIVDALIAHPIMISSSALAELSKLSKGLRRNTCVTYH
jgi:hypothetical protein